MNLPEGVRELDFPIELPASGITGVVVGAGSGEALPGATLAAVVHSSRSRPSPLGDRGFRATASADDSGRFAMSCLAPGTYDLWAWAEGHAVSRVPGIRVESGKKGGDLRVEIEEEAVPSAVAGVEDRAPRARTLHREELLHRPPDPSTDRSGSHA